jgi:vacuolar-type H+-ATPase subunit H
MSALEPDAASMPAAGGDVPSFPIVMRGYDRQQVQAFVLQLRSRLADERSRVEQAERALSRLQLELDAAKHQAPPSFEHLGAEAARVLEQAGASATLLLEEARNRGRRIVEDAEVEASDLIAQAERQTEKLHDAAEQALKEAVAKRDRLLAEAAEDAGRLRARADQEARATLEEARDEAERIQELAMSERMAMEAETARLRDSRDRMIEFLSRIHGDLGLVLAEAIASDDGAAQAIHQEEQDSVGLDGDAEPEVTDVHGPVDVHGLGLGDELEGHQPDGEEREMDLEPALPEAAGHHDSGHHD